MKPPSQLRLSTRHVAPTGGILSDKRLWALLLVIPVLLIIQLEMSWMHALEYGHNHDRFPTPPTLTASDLDLALTRSHAKTAEEVERLLAEYELRMGAKLDVQNEEIGVQKKSIQQILTEARNARAVEAKRLRPPPPSPPPPPVNATSATCGRQVDSGRLGVIEWVPRKGKYLVALCTGGQMSNRLMCIRQNMVNAAVLNRTLILPTTELDYDYSHLIDFDHFRLCFGNNSIISVSDFRALPESRGRIRFDSVLCHIRAWQSDTFCDELLQKFEKDIGAAFGTDKEILRPPPRWAMKVGQLKKKYGGKAPIVGFANMFGVPLKDAPLNGGRGGPLIASPTCRALLQPSHAIMEAARGFANTLLGNEFVAVHLRRGDFFQHCLEGDAKNRQPPCFLPIPQVAECLVSRLLSLDHNFSVIFLATDGEQQEIGLLEELVASKLGRRIPLVELPPISSQPWARGLVTHKLHLDSQVLAILTKAICGLAKEFYGSWTSTFSGDIHRLRDWWHTNTCQDSGICAQTDSGGFVALER